MARNATEEINWKPRNLRKRDARARMAQLQRSLPFGVHELFATEPARVESAADPGSGARPKRTEPAVLLWEPRPQGGGC